MVGMQLGLHGGLHGHRGRSEDIAADLVRFELRNHRVVAHTVRAESEDGSRAYRSGQAGRGGSARVTRIGVGHVEKCRKGRNVSQKGARVDGLVTLGQEPQPVLRSALCLCG